MWLINGNFDRFPEHWLEKFELAESLGVSPISREDGAVDLVITNALILDWWGIVKADVGIKDGKIYKIGKAGNPHIQDNVDIIIGTNQG